MSFRTSTRAAQKLQVASLPWLCQLKKAFT